MTINEIRSRLRRAAVVFEHYQFAEIEEEPPSFGSGLFKRLRKTLSAHKEPFQSWIGTVKYALPGEEIPEDPVGEEMIPLATFVLTDLSYVPKALEGIAVLTIFVSRNIYSYLSSDNDDDGAWFEVRQYNDTVQLMSVDWAAEDLVPVPIIPRYVPDDYPTWEDTQIPEDIVKEVMRLESNDEMYYFSDIVETNYDVHKLGGYASYCQSGVTFEDYPFVLQVTHDDEADLEIVNNGAFYFYYNADNQDWKIHCDYY